MAYIFLITVFPFCMIFAAVSDVMTMTIPNRLCLLLAAGFPVAVLAGGMPLEQAAIFAAFGVGTFFIGFALFAGGLIGGGDAKMLAATAFWIGPFDAGLYLVYATALGGALALFLLYSRTMIAPVTGFAFADRLLSRETGVPYGVALAIAGLLVYADGPFMEAALRAS
ncbi:prepilin peptidase [Fulvimarina sp. 2208YS6-2-32]|uniref:Prepilin peptidase n=1 Tax=Fulvimarina uroteuthidis TaxID=3098149 RepID=A0ABU5HZH5_9HYPH|nr:prepilin peptidase [Fulvimarina sp. 2208YS6-2-32]MDY8108455.1 prepilin peptidase [Fulvimarina sp. 2208YS6-2-32]